MAGLTAELRQDRAQMGIAMMLVAYFFFSTIDVSVKWLILLGYPALQLAFMRYFGHFVLSSLQISRGGLTWDRFASAHFALVLLRALLLVSSTVVNFFVLNYLPLTITSAILFSAPIIVCALSMPLLGESVGPWRWFAILLGFVGVLVVVRPFDEDFHWAAIVAVYSAVAFALYSILTRKLAGVIAAETMQFYMGAVGTIVLLPFAILVWATPASAFEWALMIGTGVSGWIGHGLLTRAHGFAPANKLMPYTYSFMIYVTIASYLVFATVPDTLTVTGALIIVVSGLIIWWRERERNVI